MKAFTQAMALAARAGRPMKRTLDLLTIRLLKAVAAKCRRTERPVLRTETISF